MKTPIHPRRAATVALLIFSAGLAHAQPALNLPTYVTPNVTLTTTPSFFSVSFGGLPAGLDITNRTYLAWCADVFSPVNSGQTYRVYNTYSSLPANANPGTWPSVNWILNNKPYTGNPTNDALAIQQAIWRLLNGMYYPPGPYGLPQPATDNLYNAALAHGGFVPGPGQTLAVLLYVDGWTQNHPTLDNHFQDLLHEVQVPLCILSKLGPAGAFSVLGLQGANIQLSSGPLQVNSNVGIGVNGQVHLSGGASLKSTLFADFSARVQIDGGSSFTGGVVREYFTAIQNAAVAESFTAASLTPTQTFSQINMGTGIIGNGGQNVIAVKGQLHLSGGQNLRIYGGPRDNFIFNISGGFQLDGGASIVLYGVSPNQVLFNFPGSGDQIQTSGKANTNGIFLAPLRAIQINGGVHNSEFISEGALSFQSNPIVNQIPACAQY